MWNKVQDFTYEDYHFEIKLMALKEQGTVRLQVFEVMQNLKQE